MKYNNLTEFGWGPDFQRHLSNNESSQLTPSRVISISHGICTLRGESGERTGVLAGIFYHGDIPAPVVGDWVLARDNGDDTQVLVQEVLTRRNSLSRKMPGKKTTEQVMAANIDIMFIVQDVLKIKIPLLERYLALAGGSGIRPVIVINKCDLDDSGTAAVEIAGRIPGSDVVALSVRTGTGMEELAGRLKPGVTACLLGQSGVGKSSIVNRLLGVDRQSVAEVRDGDRKGRHATTSRELFFVPGGGMIIDTPGIRELMPWDGDGIDEAFDDIAELASQCRYSDCAHESEPGCAVRHAAEEGTLDPMRLDNYRRLRREMAFLESRIDDGARLEQKRKDKELHRRIRAFYQESDKRK